MAQLDGFVKHPVKGDEHRDLGGHGKTPAHRVDLVSLIQGHHLLVHLLFVILVFFPDLGHQRLEPFHLAHRLVAFLPQRPQENLCNHRQADDRNPVVGDEPVNEVHQPQTGPGNEVEPAEINDLIQFMAKLAEHLHAFGAEKQFIVELLLCAGGKLDIGLDKAALHKTGTEADQLHLGFHRLGGHQGAEKIPVLQSDPLNRTRVGNLLSDVAHIDLFDIATDQSAGALKADGPLAVVKPADQRQHQLVLHRTVCPVFHHNRKVDQVGLRREGVDLFDDDAVF